MDILNEDKQSVESLVQFLERYVISKKSHPLYTEYSSEIFDFFKLYIHPWMDRYFVYNEEYSSEEESELKNRILDFYNTLREIFK